jgi:hypothetical protein
VYWPIGVKSTLGNANLPPPPLYYPSVKAVMRPSYGEKILDRDMTLLGFLPAK